MSAAAAPPGTLTAVLVAIGIAVVVVPAFVLLYVLTSGRCSEEGVTEDAVDPAG